MEARDRKPPIRYPNGPVPSFTRKLEGGSLWIELEGELDAFAVRDMEEDILKAIEGGDGDVVFHLGRVPFLESAAVGMLLKIRGGMEKAGRRLCLSGLRPTVRKILETMDLLRLFPVV